jgi:site-specific recombinase XerD
MGDNLVEQQLFLQIVSGTIENIINAFLVAKTSEGLSPRTLKLYAGELRRFSSWLEQIGAVTIEELDADTIRKYLLHLSETRNAAGCYIFY